MNDSSDQAPACPSCGRAMVHAGRVRRWPDHMVDLFRCRPCDVSVNLVVRAPEK
jgi:hypothetical protein